MTSQLQLAMRQIQDIGLACFSLADLARLSSSTELATNGPIHNSFIHLYSEMKCVLLMQGLHGPFPAESFKTSWKTCRRTAGLVNQLPLRIPFLANVQLQEFVSRQAAWYGDFATSAITVLWSCNHAGRLSCVSLQVYMHGLSLC